MFVNNDINIERTIQALNAFGQKPESTWMSRSILEVKQDGKGAYLEVRSLNWKEIFLNKFKALFGMKIPSLEDVTVFFNRLGSNQSSVSDEVISKLNAKISRHNDKIINRICRHTLHHLSKLTPQPTSQIKLDKEQELGPDAGKLPAQSDSQSPFFPQASKPEESHEPVNGEDPLEQEIDLDFQEMLKEKDFLHSERNVEPVGVEGSSELENEISHSPKMPEQEPLPSEEVIVPPVLQPQVDVQPPVSEPLPGPVIPSIAASLEGITVEDPSKSIYDYELFINLGSGKSARRIMNEAQTFEGMKSDQLGMVDLTEMQFRNGAQLDIEKIGKALTPHLKKITNKSIIYVVGHGSPGGSQVSSDGHVTLSIADLSNLLSSIRDQVTEVRKSDKGIQRLTIRLISCYAGLQHILGKDSYVIQLAESLYFKKIRVRLYASPLSVPRVENPEHISIAQRYELPEEIQIFPVRPNPNSPVVFHAKPVKEAMAAKPLEKADIAELDSFPFNFNYYRQDDAEKILNESADGYWLLRKSERLGGHVVSIKRNGKIEHHPIQSLGIKLKKVLHQYGLNKAVIGGLQEKIKQWEIAKKVIESNVDPEILLDTQPEGSWVIKKSSSLGLQPTCYLFLKMDHEIHQVLLQECAEIFTESELDGIRKYIKSHIKDSDILKVFGKEGDDVLKRYESYCDPVITKNADGSYTFVYTQKSSGNGLYFNVGTESALRIVISASIMKEWLANAKKAGV